MRGARGGAKAAPSSPSVDALAAIAARKAAKIEKSLNKVPAMQMIADQLAQENALKALQGAQGKMVAVEAPSTTEDVDMESDANSEDESAPSGHDEVPEPTQPQPQAATLINEGDATKVPAPTSTHAEEDVDMVDADILADFDLDSGSEKDFFMEQLRIAPPEEVDMLLSSLKRTVKPSLTKAPTPTDKTDEATQSLLKLEVADFAQKRAAALPQIIQSKEQLNDFKEEVYMYGIGLNLGETQALLAAAKAEADVVKARGLKTMKSQLAQPQPPIEAINKTIEHFTKIQAAVGELFKDLPQSQGLQKPKEDEKPEDNSTAAAKATANKRKRGRKSKGGAEIGDSATPTAASTTLATETNNRPKRQKTISDVAPSAAPVTVSEQAAAASDASKLTRKQKQELYRQELEKKRPIIAKVLPAAVNTAPNSDTVAIATAILPSAAPLPASNQPQQAASIGIKQPVQKTRQRGRKSATQRQLEKAAISVVAAPVPATNAKSGAPITSEAVSDGFVDLRAPKKRRRGRKSTGPVAEAAKTDAALNHGPAAILPDKGTLSVEKLAAPEPESVPVVAAAQNVAPEDDKDNKSKSKSTRQSKINKRKSLGNDSAAAVAVTSAPATPATFVGPAETPATVKQTPIPLPGRAIFAQRASGSASRPLTAEAVVAKTTPAPLVTPAANILPSSTVPTLPPSLVLKPGAAATSAPILPGATPKAASVTPLAGNSAPNPSGMGRKRGPRKSDVSAVNVDEPKENHSQRPDAIRDKPISPTPRPRSDEKDQIPELALDEHNAINEDNPELNIVKESVKSDIDAVIVTAKNGIKEARDAPSAPVSLAQTPTRRSTKSPHFNEVVPKTRRLPSKKLSCIPFPPLSSPRFGLIQEKLADDPFKLLIGVTFLIQTAGRSSIPVFYQLLEMYPTIEDLANANKADIVELTKHLGLQNSRADTCVKYAQMFLHDPPVKGKRYRVENYPTKKAHHGIAKGEVLGDNEDDPREGAWEIGHLTKGAYALDSWRIFCRDKLRGLAKGWNGEGAKEGFQPEWMRVMPQDKELRAFLRWCWLREGWLWNADTGEREVVGKDFVEAVNERRVVWEWQGSGSGSGKGKWRILGEEEKQPDY